MCIRLGAVIIHPRNVDPAFWIFYFGSCSLHYTQFLCGVCVSYLSDLNEFHVGCRYKFCLMSLVMRHNGIYLFSFFFSLIR